MSSTNPRVKATTLGDRRYHKMLWCLKISTGLEINNHIQRVITDKVDKPWKQWPPNPVEFL
jgi:hypothetical protein